MIFLEKYIIEVVMISGGNIGNHIFILRMSLSLKKIVNFR